MKARYVSNEVMLQCKHLPTNMTRERLDVTDAVNSRQVSPNFRFFSELLAANLALVRSCTTFSATSGLTRVRCVVVSVDR